MKTTTMGTVEVFEMLLSSWMDNKEIVLKWHNSCKPTRCFVKLVRPNYFIVEQPHNDSEPSVWFVRYGEVSSVSFSK